MTDSERLDLTSIIDDLPLWSAPFGLRLLERIRFRRQIRALDIGCGQGFPLMELAARFDTSCRFIGIDPWFNGFDRLKKKLAAYDITTVYPVSGKGEQLPFPDGRFDLVVSNNGINNVTDMTAVLRECRRVSKTGAQFVLTVNTPDTMNEFYSVLRSVLTDFGMDERIPVMENQIFHKRKPVDHLTAMLEKSGFRIDDTGCDQFSYQFQNGTVMLNHYLIKNWFVSGWRTIPETGRTESVFSETEHRLNHLARAGNGIRLTIPFITLDCTAVPAAA